MRTALVKSYALGIVTGGFLTAGIVFAAPSKADNVSVAYASTFGGAVCNVLDAYPSFDGIKGIAQAIVDDGLSFRQAGEVIAYSVTDICPRHLGLVRAFARQSETVA